MMERLAFELIHELNDIAIDGLKLGERKGIPEGERFRVPIRLPDEVKDTSHSFIDLFQAVGLSILDEQRHAEMRLAAVMLTELLNNKSPRMKEVEDVLIAITDVLHVDDESGGGE